MLSHHARTLMVIQMRLVAFDVGHMIPSIRMRALIARVVAIVSARVAVVEVVEPLHDVGVRWPFVLSTSSAASIPYLPPLSYPPPRP